MIGMRWWPGSWLHQMDVRKEREKERKLWMYAWNDVLECLTKQANTYPVAYSFSFHDKKMILHRFCSLKMVQSWSISIIADDDVSTSDDEDDDDGKKRKYLLSVLYSLPLFLLEGKKKSKVRMLRYSWCKKKKEWKSSRRRCCMCYKRQPQEKWCDEYDQMKLNKETASLIEKE